MSFGQMSWYELMRFSDECCYMYMNIIYYSLFRMSVLFLEWLCGSLGRQSYLLNLLLSFLMGSQLEWYRSLAGGSHLGFRFWVRHHFFEICVVGYSSTVFFKKLIIVITHYCDNQEALFLIRIIQSLLIHIYNLYGPTAPFSLFLVPQKYTVTHLCFYRKRSLKENLVMNI
jgi:hypothetical protein